MSSDEPLIDSLAHEIEEYLARNTEAADDVEGIMRWWLRHERRGKSAAFVKAALETLERRGVVRRTVQQDGHVIYGRAS